MDLQYLIYEYHLDYRITRQGSIWADSYFLFNMGNILFYGTWKQREKMMFRVRAEKIDRNSWNQRIFLLVVGLIGLSLPLIKSLNGQNLIRIGGFEKSFEAYSSQAGRNLILFFVIPFLISAVIMVIKKVFPTRIFNNLVINYGVFGFVHLCFKSISPRIKRRNPDNLEKYYEL